LRGTKGSSIEAAVVKSQGDDGRLRDAGGIRCPAERPAMDGRAGALRHGRLLARNTSTSLPIMEDRTAIDTLG
jgi:hypothetical protein